jgi:phage baseplate assembly protein W
MTDDWRHVVQSLIDLFTTPIGTRVMRRDYGSDIPKLIDRPSGRDVVLEVTMAAGEAIEKWEPRFRLEGVGVTEAGPDGRFRIDIVGTYYPRGHLGDYTVVEDEQRASFVI